MCTYGKLDELAALKHIGTRYRRARIVNPAEYDDHPDKRKDTVGFCLRLIEGCDVIVFSRLLDKITGRWQRNQPRTEAGQARL